MFSKKQAKSEGAEATRNQSVGSFLIRADIHSLTFPTALESRWTEAFDRAKASGGSRRR